MALTDNLVAYWKLDEASGTRSDSVGVNHLTDNAGVTQGAGKVGKSAQFTAASSQFLSITDNADLSIGDIDFSISAWVYLDSVATYKVLVSKDAGSSAANIEYSLYIYTDNKVYFDVSNGTTLGEVGSTGTVTTGVWYHIVAWHDSVANTLNQVINNGTVDSVAFSAGGRDGTSAFQIGFGLGAGHYMNGRVDEAGLWKRVLTTADIFQLYNGGRGLSYPFVGDIGAPRTAFTPGFGPTRGLFITPPKDYSVAAGAVFSDSIGETAAAADSQTATVAFISDSSETAAGTDSQTVTAAFSSASAESTAATDSETGTVTYPVSEAESATVTDSQTGWPTYPVSQAETAAAADSQVATPIFTMAVGESAAAADTQTVSAAFVVAGSDSVAAADTQTVTIAFAAALAESLASSDTQTVTASFSAALAESAAAAATQTATAALLDSIAESLTATDTNAGGATYPVSGSDSIAVADSQICGIAFTAAVDELAGVSDSQTGLLTYPVSQAESVAAADSQAAVVVSTVAVAESATASDTVTELGAIVGTGSGAMSPGISSAIGTAVATVTPPRISGGGGGGHGAGWRPYTNGKGHGLLESATSHAHGEINISGHGKGRMKPAFSRGFGEQSVIGVGRSKARPITADGEAFIIEDEEELLLLMMACH